MSDLEFNFQGLDDEHAELKKLGADVIEDVDNFEPWEKLVRAAESLEGGLNRNSSPQSIAAARDVYDKFLAKFPLFFGYWKKYADLEFSIAGTEAAEMVYERGTASITNSVDLWAQYCAFKVETSHDADIIRELFERGVNSVGLDFLAHPFWDKYMEFEERLEAWDRIFAILNRIIHIPMHQYARYFEKFRQLAQNRSLAELAPAETLAQFRAELEMDPVQKPQSEADMERELRVRIDAYHLEIFQRCQTETTKRWTYEQEIKRPYFHVTELDEAQLANWRKYLDFEEGEGDYQRTVFLYERCLVAAAYYDEFWLRYARWMLAQPGKTEEVRNIYQRASCLYVPIALPTVRLQYALFEETSGRSDVAQAIYEAMLIPVPSHIETIVAWANLERRRAGNQAAIDVYQAHLMSTLLDTSAKAALVAHWARLLWKVQGAPDAARNLFKEHAQSYLDSRVFWEDYLLFELEQPAGPSNESSAEQAARVKALVDEIRRKTQLPADAIGDLTRAYMKYILERGAKDVAKEYMTLDRQVNGSAKSALLK